MVLRHRRGIGPESVQAVPGLLGKFGVTRGDTLLRTELPERCTGLRQPIRVRYDHGGGLADDEAVRQLVGLDLRVGATENRGRRCVVGLAQQRCIVTEYLGGQIRD